MEPIASEKLSFLEPLHREIVQALAAATCQHYGMNYEALMWHRSHVIASRRQVFFYLVLHSTGLNSYTIAPAFDWHRNSIARAAETAESRMVVDKKMARDIATITRIANATGKQHNWQLAAA